MARTAWAMVLGRTAPRALAMAAAMAAAAARAAARAAGTAVAAATAGATATARGARGVQAPSCSRGGWNASARSRTSETSESSPRWRRSSGARRQHIRRRAARRSPSGGVPSECARLMPSRTRPRDLHGGGSGEARVGDGVRDRPCGCVLPPALPVLVCCDTAPGRLGYVAAVRLQPRLDSW